MLTLIVPCKELPERWPCGHWPLSESPGMQDKNADPRASGREAWNPHSSTTHLWFRYARKPLKHSTYMCHIHSCEFTKPLAPALLTSSAPMPAHSSPEWNRNVERGKGGREKGRNEGREEGKEACPKLGSVCFRPGQVKPSPLHLCLGHSSRLRTTMGAAGWMTLRGRHLLPRGSTRGSQPLGPAVGGM